jgi:phosphatidate cytidylyltransferase|tara:strand:+ start:1297 stop:1953 length:657 start_codon:yes stop_codon:yes gene_type:complete
MNNELFKRILTSVILFPIVLYVTILSGVTLVIFLSIFYFLSIYEIIKNTKNKLFIFLAGNLLFFSFYSFYYLREGSNYSLVILLWILLSTFLSDIGGYVFGKIFKGKKLSKISPNKTYSGAFGSLFLSCLSLPLINLFQNFFFNKLLINFLTENFLIITIFISLVCQLGDILVSYLKRKINIKDISNILPGHGGILDRIDGLMFVLIFCFVLKLFKLI